MVPPSVQKHITETVRAKETRKTRKAFNKTVNKAWKCEECQNFCPNKASKDAHLASRGHYINTIYKKQDCHVCKKDFSSPNDFIRHCNGNKHKRNFQKSY